MASHRIEDLDVVRGMALCGIHVVNIYQQVVLPAVYPEGVGYGVAALPDVVRYGFYERFLPVFTILFGISAGIFLVRASRRTARPRAVLVRRLTVLGLIGALHQLVHPGEVLLVYAVMGLLILLPATYLRGIGACVTGTVLVLLGGQIVPGYGVMPGLMVLGFGLARLQLPGALSRRPGRVAGALAVCVVLTAGYLVALAAGFAVPTLSWGWTSLTSQLVGILTGIAYAAAVILLLRTPLGRVLSAVLAPMGRMALTNYLFATVLILALAPLVGIDALDDAPAVAILAVGIVIFESVASAAWLRRFRYGPIEGLWRWATWGRTEAHAGSITSRSRPPAETRDARTR